MHKRFSLIQNEFILLIILIMMIVIMSLVNPSFLSLENFLDILRSSSFTGICAIGFLVVLISGGVDISFTATATVAQYIMGLLLVSKMDVPIFFVIVTPILVGTILGLLNAVLINKLKVSAIIVTIATLNLYYGAIQYVSGGKWLYSFPAWFKNLSQVQIFSFTNDKGFSYGVSLLVVFWVVISILGYTLLKCTHLGRNIYAVGGSKESAKRVGIKVHRLNLFAYSFLGAIAGIGAIVYTLMSRTIAPNAMVGLEFNVLSAVVLGGASISGGKGSILGTTIGVLLISVMTNGLTILKVPGYWHQVFIGAMLLISVSVTALRERGLQNKEGVYID